MSDLQAVQGEVVDIINNLRAVRGERFAQICGFVVGIRAVKSLIDPKVSSKMAENVILDVCEHFMELAEVPDAEMMEAIEWVHRIEKIVAAKVGE